MPSLTITGICIRQDADGRYSLNDLHRAAGGEQRHQPRYFLANQQTVELIAELGDSGNPLSVVRGGADQGTYAARELVYAYAMWISPAFHLQVIRAYDALATRPPALDALQDPATLRTLLLGYAERQLQLEQQVQEQAPKVEALDRLARARGSVCLTDAAKLLQMRRDDLIQWMQEHSWIYRRLGTPWLPYEPRVKSGMLTLKVSTIGEDLTYRVIQQVKVTPKGLARLGELLAKERATA